MRSDMKKYTAVDGAQFTDADLERWAEEAESEEPYGGAHLGPTSPGYALTPKSWAKT